MSDEPPKGANLLPPYNGKKYHVHIVGKCSVITLGDGWICALSAEAVDEIRYGVNSEVIHVLDEPYVPERIISMAACGIDDTQARIYFKPGMGEDDGEALVVVPGNSPFKASAKGRRKGVSISFDEDGNPVPEVILLYALKTDSEWDRLSALTAFSMRLLAENLPLEGAGRDLIFTQKQLSTNSPTDPANLLTTLRHIAYSPRGYREFAGRMMARAASSSEGLARWATWEKVADKALKEALGREDRYTGVGEPNDDTKFLMAVKTAAVKHSGLPSQAHVRKLWWNLHVDGEWGDVRHKLGFDWLPTMPEWEHAWTPLMEHICNSCQESPKLD